MENLLDDFIEEKTNHTRIILKMYFPIWVILMTLDMSDHNTRELIKSLLNYFYVNITLFG